ncbi:MAG: hypothetical protein KAF91_15810 [Nostoc sp. TH1S01]|nr:hypothetical protein [Nostoc sp. TH1S01]
MISKPQQYLLGLVFATTLSANIQSVNAVNIQSVDDLKGSVSLSTSEIGLKFEPLTGNQYEPNAPFMELTQNANSTAIFPNYDGGLFQDTDVMSEAIEAAVVGLTVSKYDKTPVGANKVFMSKEHENAMMVVSVTSLQSTPISGGNQTSEVRRSPETNHRYEANPQYLRRGTLVSTNYNAVSMLRTMEDLQNIAYVGVNEVNAEPISDALNRELKATNHVAFLPDYSCVHPEDSKLPTNCQNKNAEKMVSTMPMIHDKTWSAQMDKDFSFSQSMNVSTETAMK